MAQAKKVETARTRLRQRRGKDFTREKRKMKKTSSRGIGIISTEVKSQRFEDD